MKIKTAFSTCVRLAVFFFILLTFVILILDSSNFVNEINYSMKKDGRRELLFLARYLTFDMSDASRPIMHTYVFYKISIVQFDR